MKTYLLLFLILSLLSFSLAEQCGRQAGGALCPNGLCCSAFGFCGNTEAYCKQPGCQSQCTPGGTPPAPPPGPPPLAEHCGRQAGGALCPNGLCCSEYGWCGNTEDYCKQPGCQSQCTPGDTPPGPTDDLSGIISRSQFEHMLKQWNNSFCLASGFYTYDAFLTAAKSFPGFGTTGDTAARKKELAAFFGQTSYETYEGVWGTEYRPYSWGYCLKRERFPSSDYCSPTAMWSCANGKRYYGRGPMKMRWNYNYGQCGRAIEADLLNNPDLVTSDALIAFKSAIWFWMTPQSPKPSCHAVIAGQWQPSDADLAARRLPGYGVITNIINGEVECGHGAITGVSRVGFYERYCNILGVNPGGNLDCYNQESFASFNFILNAAI